ncbi:MAG: DUF3604 domain-containing protein, partial [Alphaproteobacteria bacterium]
QTFCETEFQFRVFVDAIATYDYVAIEDSPRIQVAPGPGVDWHAVLPTLVRPGEPFRLSIKANDKWGNPSDLVSKRLHLEADAPVSGLPETAELRKGEFACVVEGLTSEAVSQLRITVRDEAGEILAVSNPLRVAAEPGYRHYWGDLHGQSNETLGTNTAEEYFLFGRDRAFLDVCSHQGNDFQITGEFWEELNALTARLDRPGRFVCIPGYEWSANTAVGGDRNVFYRHEGRPIYRSSHAQVPDLSDEEADAHNAHELFERLKDEDCVMYAHCGGRYADITYAHDGRKEASVEVHSSWGTFEWLLHDAFAKNYRVGVVCNSDGHKGRVGASYPGASFFGALGGLTCFLAGELDRDSIFEAIRRRHHYGTTGNRMYLSVLARLSEGGELFARDPALFEMAGEPASEALMGDIVRASGDAVELSVEALGSAPIEQVDIFDGTELIETYTPYEREGSSRRVRLLYSGAEYRGRARTTTWDGSLSVEGNAISRAEMFNNWNLDRGITDSDAGHISWKAVTTGNFGGIDLWLDDPASGTLHFETPHASDRVDISAIDYDGMTYEAGGLERSVRLYRLPEVMTQTHFRCTRTVPLRTQCDTRLYVRVTQADGHRAWTSPIYLFR